MQNIVLSQIYYIFVPKYKNSMINSTAKRIETAICSETEGKIIFSTDYAELGTPEAINWKDFE